jgi:hypothetical protein
LASGKKIQHACNLRRESMEQRVSTVLTGCDGASATVLVGPKDRRCACSHSGPRWSKLLKAQRQAFAALQ